MSFLYFLSLQIHSFGNMAEMKVINLNEFWAELSELEPKGRYRKFGKR
jgi:uncharacterized Fe-S cluster-containing radical SAM superfamily enzyme